jgi:hypothetical protein
MEKQSFSEAVAQRLIEQLQQLHPGSGGVNQAGTRYRLTQPAVRGIKALICWF